MKSIGFCRNAYVDGKLFRAGTVFYYMFVQFLAEWHSDDDWGSPDSSVAIIITITNNQSDSKILYNLIENKTFPKDSWRGE